MALSKEKKKENNRKEAYKKWYAANKEQFNEDRRKRYKKDKSYRERALENTRTYRRCGTDKPLEEKMYRKFNDKKVEVFRISKASELVGRSIQTLRQWEAAGVIPYSVFDEGHRLYTKKQIALMKRVVTLYNKYRHNTKRFPVELEKMKVLVQNKWEEG